MTPLSFAARHAAERGVLLGSLAVTATHYVAEGAPPDGRAVAGLSVRPVEGGKGVAIWHETTRVYGLLDLRAGPIVLHLSDPIGRYVERLAAFTVPDRTVMRRALEAGARPAASAVAGILHKVAMRPAVGHAIRTGQTSIWGVVRGPAGEPRPFARLSMETRLSDGTSTRLVTHADADGLYRMVLHGERAAFTPPVPATDTTPAFPASIATRFDRRLDVHVLSAVLLPGRPAAAAFPPAFDTLDPDGAGSPYAAATARIEGEGGPVAPAAPGAPLLVPLTAGENRRWDIVTS